MKVYVYEFHLSTVQYGEKPLPWPVVFVTCGALSAGSESGNNTAGWYTYLKFQIRTIANPCFPTKLSAKQPNLVNFYFEIITIYSIKQKLYYRKCHYNLQYVKKRIFFRILVVLSIRLTKKQQTRCSNSTDSNSNSIRSLNVQTES